MTRNNNRNRISVTRRTRFCRSDAATTMNFFLRAKDAIQDHQLEDDAFELMISTAGALDFETGDEEITPLTRMQKIHRTAQKHKLAELWDLYQSQLSREASARVDLEVQRLRKMADERIKLRTITYLKRRRELRNIEQREDREYWDGSRRIEWREFFKARRDYFLYFYAYYSSGFSGFDKQLYALRWLRRTPKVMRFRRDLCD
jgi:hypothetical protein